MDSLNEILGKEVSLDEIPHRIRRIADELSPAVVGAMLQTCADESEHECEEAFQRGVARRLLPALKFGEFAPFRLATLGSHYEWRSVRLAENHFAVPPSADHFKLLIVKMNSHVSKDPGFRYGEALRYEVPSTYCGALHALRMGAHEPFTDSLREDFQSEQVDRLRLIEERVEEPFRALAAAIANARIQARKAVLELQDFHPATPTLFLVLPCVTLNLPQRDNELLCGYYVIDRREDPSDQYTGLGDDPSRYRITHDRTHLVVTEGAKFEGREARDHRGMARMGWTNAKLISSEKLEEVRNSTNLSHVAKPLLKGLVYGVGSAMGVPTALFLFAEGLVGIHHAWRAHRLLKEAGSDEDVQVILREFEAKLDTLPKEKAERAVQALLSEYKK